MILDRMRSTRSESTRGLLAQLLATLGERDPAGVIALIAALRDGPPSVHMVKILGKLGNRARDAISELRKLALRDDPLLQVAVAEALEDIEGAP